MSLAAVDTAVGRGHAVRTLLTLRNNGIPRPFGDLRPPLALRLSGGILPLNSYRLVSTFATWTIPLRLRLALVSTRAMSTTLATPKRYHSCCSASPHATIGRLKKNGSQGCFRHVQARELIYRYGQQWNIKVFVTLLVAQRGRESPVQPVTGCKTIRHMTGGAKNESRARYATLS